MTVAAESRGAYADALLEIGAQHPDVVVIDAGLGTSMQTEAFAAAFPERYLNLGIAEQNAVGVASGLARRGFVPLVHSFSNFLARRAHDQIAVSVAWPRCNVKLIGGSCGLYDARNGPSHLAVDDLAAMAALPGMTVMEPCDVRRARALLERAVTSEGPVYFRLRRHGAPSDLVAGGDPAAGTFAVDTPPRPVATVIAVGTMLQSAVGAARILADFQRPVDLFGVTTLPLQAAELIASVARTRLAVIVENHVPSGGFGCAVAEALGPLCARIARFALPYEFLPAADAAWQLRRCELDPDGLAIRIAELVDGA